MRNADAAVADEPTEGVAMPVSADPSESSGPSGPPDRPDRGVDAGAGPATDRQHDVATTDDAAWFTALVHAHATALVRYFARRGPRQDAEDLASEVFATAWRRRDDVPRDAELPWLYRTAGFTLANHRRKHVDLPIEDVPEAGAVRVADDPELSALFDAELRGALASVGERDRRILLLHAWEGLDGEELAQVLGISRSGADAALSRARKRLREAWGERLTF